MTKATVQLYQDLRDRGFTFEEATALRRIEKTLNRWACLECGDSNNSCSYAIERDEETEKPFMVYHPYTSNDVTRVSIPDREAGALKRLAKIMETHADYVSFHQTDPRGCSLYIVRKSDVNGSPIDTCYTRGLAVCA